MKFILLLFLVFILSACQPQPEKAVFFVFGTQVEVIIYHKDKELIQQAMTEIQNQLYTMHNRWHAWQPSEITNINQAIAQGKKITIAKDIADLISSAQYYEKLSQGLFNPTIGKLLQLWGFQSDDLPEKPPKNQDIQLLLQQQPSLQAVRIENNTIYSENPYVQLDLGAFAKGYALDKIIEYLEDLGIKNAIINTGGDLKVIGRANNRAWSIGIRHPRANEVLAGILLQDKESIFTSGDYERFFIYENKHYHHILNPNTGYPTEDLISVTVITENAALADAASTALLVAGEKNWPYIAHLMGIDQVLVMTQDQQLQATPKMAARVTFPFEKHKMIIKDYETR